MKNYQIITLVNAGILSISANDLDAAHAYKVLQFKRAVKKSLDAFLGAEMDLLKEAGIADGPAFDKEREELRKSGSDPARLAELDKTFAWFGELRTNLYNEDCELGTKAIPYEQFHALQKENRDMKNKPLNAFEDLLEGVLWAGSNE